MRYRSKLGISSVFVPESVKRELDFHHGELRELKEFPSASEQEPFLLDTSKPPIITEIVETMEVKAVTFLDDGEVLFREWTRPNPPDWFRNRNRIDDHFRIVKVETVLELVLARGASGPIDELKALLPSKSANRNPSYSSYDPNHTVSADGKPCDQSDLEKGEPENAEIPTVPSRPSGRSNPGRKSSIVARKKDSENFRLAREYVAWAEKLSEKEFVRIFCHGRRGACPSLAIREFMTYARENSLKLPIRSRNDEYIRDQIEKDEGLSNRIRKLISKASTLRKRRRSGAQ